MSSTITIIGNLTRDPEMRYTANGQSNARLGVAVSRRWMNRQTNEWQEQTSFFNVVCWGDLANNVSESLVKGARVVVTGRLEQRSYENAQGEQKQVVEIVADEIGPSLRYATAQVQRTERRDGGDFGGGGPRGGQSGQGGQGGSGDGGRRPVPASASAPAREASTGGAPANDDYGFDEEPF
jgi:single-strand DNA-binding protein